MEDEVSPSTSVDSATCSECGRSFAAAEAKWFIGPQDDYPDATSAMCPTCYHRNGLVGPCVSCKGHYQVDTPLRPLTPEMVARAEADPQADVPVRVGDLVCDNCLVWYQDEVNEARLPDPVRVNISKKREADSYSDLIFWIDSNFESFASADARHELIRRAADLPEEDLVQLHTTYGRVVDVLRYHTRWSGADPDHVDVRAACERQLALAPLAARAFRLKHPGRVLPDHHGLYRLLLSHRTLGDHADDARLLDLARRSFQEGWLTVAEAQTIFEILLGHIDSGRRSGQVSRGEVVAACRGHIELAPQLACAFKAIAEQAPLPGHAGYLRLAMLLEGEKDYEGAIRVCNEARAAGWSGDWMKRVTRCVARSGRASIGAETLAMVAAIQPDDAEITSRLAELLRDADCPIESADDLQRLVEMTRRLVKLSEESTDARVLQSSLDQCRRLIDLLPNALTLFRTAAETDHARREGTLVQLRQEIEDFDQEQVREFVEGIKKLEATKSPEEFETIRRRALADIQQIIDRTEARLAGSDQSMSRTSDAEAAVSTEARARADRFVVDVHYLLESAISAWYGQARHLPDPARKSLIDATIAACELQIGFASTVAEARSRLAPGANLYSHSGYTRLAMIMEQQGALVRVVKLCEQAQEQGWKGDWEKRIARCCNNLAGMGRRVDRAR